MHTYISTMHISMQLCTQSVSIYRGYIDHQHMQGHYLVKQRKVNVCGPLQRFLHARSISSSPCCFVKKLHSVSIFNVKVLCADELVVSPHLL